MVEVVIASAILLAAIVTLLSIHSLYLKIGLSNVNSAKAAYLLEEAVEAMRFLRDDSWGAKVSTLTLNTNYGLVFNNGSWQASTTNRWVENFERTIALSAVYRDANGDIGASGALDPSTLLVVSTVSWPKGGATTTRSISTYLTNLYDN